MRAARLLEMMMLLQRRGRLTARQLADALDVSPRTVLRDVEALSEVGVPVYATRGPAGGIELLHGFRTQLTGLTDEDAAALYLVGQPLVARRLGLSTPARTARTKLLAALPPALAERADEVSAWFLHDPDPVNRAGPASGELRRLVRCLQEGREADITVGGEPPRRVRPLGLVLRAGTWLLIAAGPDAASRSRIDLTDLRAVRVTTVRFTAPADFDLAAYWRELASSHPG